IPHECSQSPSQRSAYHSSSSDKPVFIVSGAGAAGLGAFAAEVGGEDFNGATHFEEARAHAGANALVEGIFAGGHDEFSAGEARGFAFGGGIVVIVCRNDGGAAFVVAGIEDDADDVTNPVG